MCEPCAWLPCFRRSGYTTKIKILITLYQILQGLGSSFAIPTPDFYNSFVGGIGSAIQIELPSLVPVGCITPINFYNTLVFSTTYPLILYLICYLASLGFTKCGRAAQASMVKDFAFFVMFLLCMWPRLHSLAHDVPTMRQG